MILVGVLAIALWKTRRKIAWKYFVFGAFMWTVAIAPKYAMDLTVTYAYYRWLTTFGSFAALAGISIYVGLRTGLFESGFSYIAVLKTRFNRMNVNEAVAFGIGFGAIEAIFLGAETLSTMLVFLFNPSIISQLPQASRASLDLPTIVVFAPIIERVFTLFIHVFSSVLVVYAAVRRKAGYLALSILFKTFVDGMVPSLTTNLNLTTVSGIYVAEIPVVVLGVASFLMTKLVLKKFQTSS
jgi:uncharacterized membrane protein YhfC